MNFEDHIEELKALLPKYIHSVHGHRIDQRRSNETRILMTCPYHEDKSPSLHIDDKKGTWLGKCFGCGAGGSIIDFALMDGEQGTFNAIKKASSVVGYDFPSETNLDPSKVAEWKAKRQRERVMEVERIKKEKELEEKRVIYEKHAIEEIKRLSTDEWRANMFHSSPIMGDLPEYDAWAMIQRLFSPDDVIWVGGFKDSGLEKHTSNFRKVSEWLKFEVIPFPRIAPCTFKEGSCSRRQEFVLEEKFICIESDDLIGKKPETDQEKWENQKLNHGLIKYLIKNTGMNLRCVIDTGNKSLHSWWDKPSNEELDCLKAFAPSLRIDKSCLEGVNNPLRLPNFKHEKTGKKTTLLYLK